MALIFNSSNPAPGTINEANTYETIVLAFFMGLIWGNNFKAIFLHSFTFLNSIINFHQHNAV